MHAPIVQTIKVVLASKEVEAELWRWDEAPEDRKKVKLQILFDDVDIQTHSADGYFRALVDLRMRLEAMHAVPCCNGACLNVYPSPMIEAMGNAEKAYKLSLGKPTTRADLVSIFDFDPELPTASVREQSLFYEKWCRSLG